jgi:hypothetical protein
MLPSGDGTHRDRLWDHLEADAGVEQQVGQGADRRPLSGLELDGDGLAPVRVVETGPADF